MDKILGIAAIIISLLSALFTYFQVRAAKRSLRQASQLRFFTTFDLANQLCVENPELIRAVHGLNAETDELKNIAYLSLLLDAFQHFYADKYAGDYKKMEVELKNHSSFLNRILSVPENKARWFKLRSLYYGEFDSTFVHAIDSLIEYEESKHNRPSESSIT